MRACSLGEESSVPDIAGSAILQNDLEFDLDEEDEIFEAYGTRKNAYPYRQYQAYSRELKERRVKTAVLENDCLRAVFFRNTEEGCGNFGIRGGKKTFCTPMM